VILGVLLLAILAPAAPQSDERIDQVLDAIRIVETGGEPNGGRDATGDQGRSIGPYQIQRAYWIDSGVAGRWEDCREPEYARRVVKAYWMRYCANAYERVDAEVLARIHNGGATGHRKAGTRGYWRRVERELARLREDELVRVADASRSLARLH
jgi:hypothetical protein